MDQGKAKAPNRFQVFNASRLHYKARGTNYFKNYNYWLRKEEDDTP